jgi:hypothetical protein
LAGYRGIGLVNASAHTRIMRGVCTEMSINVTQTHIQTHTLITIYFYALFLCWGRSIPFYAIQFPAIRKSTTPNTLLPLGPLGAGDNLFL